ncbi:MAG: AAA family ATPase [Solirubrobacterales bacterium]|nr:AAA family ATPase [Solirubrobacterales bacterium]
MTLGVPGTRRAIPRPTVAARRLVQRDGLFDRLSTPEGGGVLLVCAPAGSGKTVLLRSWIEAAGLEDQLGWVSVERAERDAQRFWLAVIDALAGAVDVVERVAPAPTFHGRAVVEQLLADLDLLEEPAVLVIDDLHELESADALEWLELFLARLPSPLRVVLATREDPRLGLHRLRLSGQLTELRSPDLRFSMEEMVELLRADGITVSDGAASLLYERTEGWAAGLRLAAISLAEQPDPDRFIAEFSGSERNVAGYLLAEVLERQPAEVREMLLRTSVLERVCGPLGDFLTGGLGAERMLQELEDANAFVTSIDARRFWFRYHHLFADLLQLELRRARPALVGSLHRAAAEWHEQQGYIVEATRHAQAARDWGLASRLLADHHIDLALDGSWGTVCQLLSAFPADVAAADPELALVSATAHLLEGALDKSATYVDLAGRLADAVSEEHKPEFDVLLAALRLALARWHGDLETVLEMRPVVEAAVAAQPPGETALGDEIRSVAFGNLGVAELWSSRLDDARRDLERGLALARRAGRPWLEIAWLAHLGIAGPLTGLSLSAGLALSQDAMRVVDAHGWGEDPVTVTALGTGAMALLWLGQIDEAEQWLMRAERTVRPGGEPGTELIVDYARALLCLARDSPAEALAALHSATQMEGLLAGEHAFGPVVRARLVQTEARMGNLQAARAALDGVSAQERNVGDMRAAAAVIHLSEGEPEVAIEVLAPVLDGSAPVLHRPSMVTEAQLLDAVAREQLGDQPAAEASLERALDLAEPEGVLLPFILVPVQPLLDRPSGRRTAHPALRRVILDVLAGAVPPGGVPAGDVDALSEAELRVVRYLPTNLRTPEIASELFVSTNTVRTHLRHIYAKLGAHGRAEAVDRARQLGLLAPSHQRR